jgi:hypothetical protein
VADFDPVFLVGGSVDTKFNDNIGRYLKTNKGLRHGDPLSPMIFKIVANMLPVMIEFTNVHGQIGGVVPNI